MGFVNLFSFVKDVLVADPGRARGFEGRRAFRSTLRGRCSTYGIGLCLVARLVLRCRRRRCGFLRGKHGTWGHVVALWVEIVALCVAGMAL